MSALQLSERRQYMARKMEAALEIAMIKKALEEVITPFADELNTESVRIMIANALHVELDRIDHDGDIAVVGGDGPREISIGLEVKLETGGKLQFFSFINAD